MASRLVFIRSPMSLNTGAHHVIDRPTLFRSIINYTKLAQILSGDTYCSPAREETTQ